MREDLEPLQAMFGTKLNELQRQIAELTVEQTTLDRRHRRVRCRRKSTTRSPAVLSVGASGRQKLLGLQVDEIRTDVQKTRDPAHFARVHGCKRWYRSFSLSGQPAAKRELRSRSNDLSSHRRGKRRNMKLCVLS
jgi:hypothetical protein